MVYTKTCSGEHLFSLDSRHGPNPEWNVDLAFTYGAFASQSVMHVTVNQMFYSASDLTDSLTSSVGSGHMLWEEKAVKWKATLSMNQVLLCGHGEEVKVMLMDNKGRPSRASVNFVVHPTGRLDEDGSVIAGSELDQGSASVADTSAAVLASGDLPSWRGGDGVGVRDSVGSVFSILEEREEAAEDAGLDHSSEGSRWAGMTAAGDDMQEVEGSMDGARSYAEAQQWTWRKAKALFENSLADRGLSHLLDHSASGSTTSTQADTRTGDHDTTSVHTLTATDGASHPSLPSATIATTTTKDTTGIYAATFAGSIPEDDTLSSVSHTQLQQRRPPDLTSAKFEDTPSYRTYSSSDRVSSRSATSGEDAHRLIGVTKVRNLRNDDMVAVTLCWFQVNRVY